ncbi:MAG TPA: hypothetical protein VMU42_07130, partial [Candidatus Sulfotelmatobacter sp.]|nr:hypothetical protein [Candidatus Sulfotelmatobacter sp.]
MPLQPVAAFIPAYEAALAVIQGGAPIDLMLTDVVLGSGMNGRGLAEEARAAVPALKVLYMS